MQLPDDVAELHLIAEAHIARRELRTMGWGGVVFGVINIGLGIFFTIHLHPINALLALVGLSVLASGLWCLLSPGAEGVIANGITLIGVGLWNLFITVLDLVAGGDLQIFWAIFGIVQIAASIRCFQNYGRFSAALRHRVSRGELAMMDRLVKTVLKANIQKDADIVTFEVRAFTRQKIWNGQLGQRIAVFVEKMSKEIVVARKEEVNITPHGKVWLGKSFKASVLIGKHQWEAVIAPTSFDRFRDWKRRGDEAAPCRSAEADEREPETGFRAKDESAPSDSP